MIHLVIAVLLITTVFGMVRSSNSWAISKACQNSSACLEAVEKEKDWVGELKAFDKDTVTILVNEKEQTLERKNISKMNEYVEW